MKRRELLATGLLLVSAAAVHGETLQQYVQSCKTELGFVESVPDLNCYDGDLFAPTENDSGPEVNDFMGYARINDSVDLTFACRWLFGSKAAPQKAFSVEMMLHNRGSGKTCYFSAKEPNAPPSGQETGKNISPLMLSITGPNAADYWEPPSHVANPPYAETFDLNRNRQCVTCHIKGPYIVSPRIAPFLAKYGILNNGHDNFRSRRTASAPFYSYSTGKGYLAVAPSGSEFAHFNDIIYGTVDRKKQSNATLVPPQPVIVNDGVANVIRHDEAINECTGCHDRVASTFPRINVEADGGVVLPSIHSVMNLISPHMPPTGIVNSAYRWVNDDSLSDGQDIESFTEIGNPQKAYLKNIYAGCTTPTFTQARAVGSDFILATDQKFPDTLEYFNVKQGLKCTVNQQSDGQCNDYEVRYYCPGTGNGRPYWTHRYAEAWYDVDDPTNSADEESRSNLANAGVNLCGGQKPLDIEARTRVGSRVYSFVGPRDRLAKFAASGLECRDSEQPDFGQTGSQHACSNYSVRYTYCDGEEVIAQPAYFEIQVTAGISQRASGGDVAEMRVYVDNIPLNDLDAAEQLPASAGGSHLKTFTYRTNATGELRIVTNGPFPVHVDDVAINGLSRGPLQKVTDPGERITLRARGISGSEIIRLTVGGQEVARFALGTTWKMYTAYTQVFGGLNVEFINDASGRDVELDWVNYNGTTHQTEAQTYNTATYGNGRCGGARGSMMHCGTNNPNSGVIGFNPVVNYHAGKTEISYGQISSLAMPDVVTVQDRYDETSSGFCARLSAWNTTGTSQNMRFDFNIGTSTLLSSWNFTPQGSTGVIRGQPVTAESLLPLSRSLNTAVGYTFCAN